MKSWSAPIAGVLVLTTSALASSQMSGDGTNPLNDELYCQVTEAMNRVTNIVGEGRTHIDRSAFDLDAKLDQLDYDANDIVTFARHSIAFEQYAGSLRGPRGTLLSLAGNTLDQSLLLGKLLRDAGYEARIARATLDDESTATLLRQMRHPATNSNSGQINEELAASLVKLAGDQISPAELLEQLELSANPKTDLDYKKVQETTRFLRDALADAGIETRRQGDQLTLIEEAKDYFWVQYKELVADGWTDAHPAFVDDPPNAMPEPVNFISGAVPADLLHRIRLQFFVERSIGGKLEAVPISDVWEHPTANLVDTPVSFSVIPIGISSNTVLEGGIAEALDDSAIFATIVNGSILPGGQFFDLKGNIIDPMAASGPAAGVVATLGDRFGRAAEALGSDVPTLTAYWIQITLVAPDGSETSYRRTTLDRIGPAARAKGNSPDILASTKSADALNLLRKHTLMVATGRTPRSLVVDRVFDWTLRAEPMYQQLREQAAYRAYGDLENPEFKPVEDLPTYWPGHLSLFSVFDRASSLVDSHRLYRASPGVVIHILGQRNTDTVFEMIDIVTNARRAVMINNDMPRLDPQTAIIAGVWDTAKEGALLKPGDTRVDTESVFSDAIANNKRLVTLPPGKLASGVTLSPDIEALVQSDLSRGFAVVLPDGQEVVENSAWWRVNPYTGETVGQAMDGRGVDFTESALTKIGFLVTGAALLYGVDQCEQAYRSCRRPSRECTRGYHCCMGLSFVGAIVGFFLLAAEAIALDTAASAAPPLCP